MNNYQNHPLAGAVDLDTAFNKMWFFYKKYFLGLYIISVISALLTSLFTSGIDLASFQEASTDPELVLEKMKEMAGPYAMMMLVSLVFGVLLHAWVLEKPSGEQGFISSLTRKTLTSLVPYLAAAIILLILTLLLTSVGLVLLVLPGLFAVFYMVTVILFAMPVTMIETRNPIEAVSRSFRLTHKNFWANMGWVIVVLLIIIVASMLIGALVMLPFTGSFISSIANPEEASSLLDMHRNPLFIVLNALLSGLITPVMPILAFLLYFRNRGDEVTVEVTTDSDFKVKVEDLYPPMPGKE
ncbi:MAG: glycerophosphoryl diester phosphodiesterase membrane domain-containing protein [Bacteroidales bacterium]